MTAPAAAPPAFDGADTVEVLRPFEVPANLFDGDRQVILVMKVYMLPGGDVCAVEIRPLCNVIAGDGRDLLCSLQIRGPSIARACNIADRWLRSVAHVVNPRPSHYALSRYLYVVSNA